MAMFGDRVDAGRRLAERLEHLRGGDNVVAGLPRGGIVVAHEVARALAAPLDVILVRKLGVPTHPELAMGAIGEDGVRVLNDDIVRSTGVSNSQIANVEHAERATLEQRAERFRSVRAREPLARRTVIIVDDGIATGSTARAACGVARAAGVSHLVVAVPVAPPAAHRELSDLVDELICIATPELFAAVGQFYGEFGQTTDQEVVDHLVAALHELE